MKKKRIIGNIVVKNNIAVQSMGYSKYLPLGKPELLAENLDRWGIDEIFVKDISRSIASLGPNFELIKSVAKKIGTPLTYAGGINSVDEAKLALSLGADRIAIDSLLHTNPLMISTISKEIGAQAMVVTLPATYNSSKQEINILNYRTGKIGPIKDGLIEFLRTDFISEIVIIDWMSEGKPGNFDKRLIQYFPETNIPLVASGGVGDGEVLIGLLDMGQIEAVAIGNPLNYREHSLEAIRIKIGGGVIRKINFQENLNE